MPSVEVLCVESFPQFQRTEIREYTKTENKNELRLVERLQFTSIPTSRLQLTCTALNQGSGSGVYFVRESAGLYLFNSLRKRTKPCTTIKVKYFQFKLEFCVLLCVERLPQFQSLKSQNHNKQKEVATVTYKENINYGPTKIHFGPFYTVYNLHAQP